MFGAAVSCIVGLGAAFATSHARMTPDPAKGFVVPVNVHGTIGYITHAHALWLDGAWWVFGLCFLYAWPSIAYPQWRKWRDAGGTKV